MRFGLSSVCPLSFGSPYFHRPPQTSSLLFFHVFLSSCLFIPILSFSCAHFRPDLSLYTYTHAYSTYNEVQVAQVCYNEVWFIGCPSSLGSSSSATTHTHTHTFRLSRLFHFHLSLLRAHVPCLLSGQDGGHTCRPSGRRVCVTLGITGNPRVWSRGCDSRFPSHANEAMEIDWMEAWTQPSVPAPLFWKTRGNGTRHTCVSVPFLLFSYSIGCR